MSPEAPNPAAAVSRIQETAELVKRFCLALTNVEMFSAQHPMARKFIDSAYEWLGNLLTRQNAPVVISVSDKRIIVDGMPLEDKNPLVAKLGARLEDYHVTNLFFEPGLTAGEFTTFYGILGKGPRQVNEQGGLAALMAEAKLDHVKLRSVSYVMVNEDEKIVSRSALVQDRQPTPGAVESNLVQYMIGKVLQKAEEQKWLIDEIKNNPSRIADLITEGIDLAASRAEMGLAQDDQTISTLLHNIQLVAQNMAQGAADSPAEDAASLERSIMTLENEIRLRSSKVMSSKVAQGFLNEVLAMVTTYSDRTRAKQIAGEFLKGERGLKRTEKLLRELAPKDESKETFVTRIKALLTERGLSDNDIASLLDAAVDKPKPPPRVRKPKPVAQLVTDGLQRRLKDVNLSEPERAQLTDTLGTFVDDLAQQRAKEFKVEAEILRADVSNRTTLLDNLPWGVILWNKEGQAAYLNAAGQALLKVETTLDLREPVKALLNAWSFPLKELPDFPPEAQLTEAEIRLLVLCFRVVRDDAGGIQALILMPER